MAKKASEIAATRGDVDVNNILLDLDNFRSGHHNSQKEVADAIISEQEKKLVVLATDILANGFSPFDLPLLYPEPSRPGKFTMLEGNRRLLALKLLLEPDIAKGSTVHGHFKKLHDQNLDRTPTSLFCAMCVNRKAGLLWAGRKHAKALDGAGTEDWNAIARERFDAEMDIPTPNLDALDFVRAHSVLERDVADAIDSSKFAISTFARILGDETIRSKLGLTIVDGRFSSTLNQAWVARVLGQLVTIISTSKFNGKRFTVREVDTQSAREAFIDQLLEGFDDSTVASKPWSIHKDVKRVGAKPEISEPRKKQSISSKDRKQLIPRDFKLSIPQGKVNDVYLELKRLNIFDFENAVAVLMRVFVEFSVERFVEEFKVKYKGQDSLFNKITACVSHIESNNWMTSKQLTAINTELANKNSFISPVTLNAYVHNPTFSANEGQLKTTWNRLQPLVTVLWREQP